MITQEQCEQVVKRMNIAEADKPKVVELLSLFDIATRLRESDMPQRAADLFDEISEDSTDAFKQLVEFSLVFGRWA